MDEAPQALNLVLENLRTHGDDLGGVLADEELNTLLEPFREDAPRLVRCAHDGCRGKLVHIAVDPFRPGVVGKTDGPVSDKLLAKRRKAAQLPSAPRPEGLPPLYEHWSVTFGRRTIGEAVDTDRGENERLRWVITCPKPKCRTPYLVTHTELLTLLVAGIAKGPGDIMMPPGCEVRPDWKLSLRPQSR